MLNLKDKRCTTWYGIAEQVTSLWEEITKELNIEISEMKITMVKELEKFLEIKNFFREGLDLKIYEA